MAPQKGRKSEMWSKGVVLAKAPLHESCKKTKFKWYCMVTEACKEAQESILLGSTMFGTNVVKHLKRHGIVSERSASMVSNKRKRDEDVSDLVRSDLFVDDKTLALEYSYNMMVFETLLPHNLA